MDDSNKCMTTTTTSSLGKRKRQEKKTNSTDAVARVVGATKKSVATEVGKIVRTHVKISCPEWSQVPEGLKETVWLEAKKKFNITDDSLRGSVLVIAADRLRAWRTYMTTMYVTKTRKQSRKEPITDPTTIYSGITKEDWALFVKQRSTDEFQEKSRKAQESQKHNVHPHYLGRSPYASKVPQWEKEEVEAILASNPDADIVATQEAVAKKFEDRSYPWIISHTPPLAPPPPQTQKVIDDIKHWKTLEEKGEFVPKGKEDVLVKALGKPEHPGRTRGVGSRVGNQAYFGKPSSRREASENSYTKAEFSKMKEEVEKATLEKVNERLGEFFKKLNVALPEELFGDTSTTVIDNYESTPQVDQLDIMPSILTDDPFMELKEPVPCRLAVKENDVEEVVAEGTAWPWKEGTLVHHKPLSRHNVRVSVDKILAGKSSHPVPWDANVRVADVFGSFEQWPKMLVYLENNETEEAHKRDSPNKESNTGSDIMDKGKSKEVDKEVDLKETNASTSTFQQENETGPNEKSLELETAKQSMGCENENNNTKDKAMFTPEKVVMGAKAPTSAAEPAEKQGPLDDNELRELSEHCQRLERNISAAELGGVDIFTINISKLVYGYDEDVEQPLLYEDIREMFRYYCLNITVLIIWGSFLYEYVNDRLKKENLVGFLCPVKLSSYAHDKIGVEKFLTDALKANEKNRYIMGAFREGYHWMLLVFEVGENSLYILDSAQRPSKQYSLRSICLSAWKPYRFRSGRCHPHRKDLKVKVIQCPQQTYKGATAGLVVDRLY